MVADFYYEKYIIELLFKLNLLVVKNNKLGIKNEIENNENLKNDIQVKEKFKNIAKTFEMPEIKCNNVSYNLTFSDFIINQIPFLIDSNCTYQVVINQIYDILSVNNIISRENYWNNHNK